MEIISNIALISINETMIVQLLSFLIFLFIINRLMFRPLSGVMDERNRYMEKLKQDVISAGEEMTAVTRRMREQEDAIRTEAGNQLAELEDAGARKASEIFNESRKKINEMKGLADSDIRRQITDARQHLKKEAEVLAGDIIEKILHRRPHEM